MASAQSSAKEKQTVTPIGEHFVNVLRERGAVIITIYWNLPKFTSLVEGVVFICPLESTSAFSIPGWKLGLRKYRTQALLNAWTGIKEKEITFSAFTYGPQTPYFVGQGQEISPGMYQSLVSLSPLNLHSDRSPARNLVITCRVKLREEDLAYFSAPFPECTCNGLRRDLHRLFESQRFSDFRLKRGCDDFLVHKCLLYARSPTMLRVLTSENRPLSLKLKHNHTISYSAVSEVLRFLYTANFSPLDADIAVSMYHVADSLEMDDLKRICLRFLKRNISVESFMRFYSLSRLINIDSVSKILFWFFTENLQTIMDHYFPEDGLMIKPPWMTIGEYEGIQTELRYADDLAHTFVPGMG